MNSQIDQSLKNKTKGVKCPKCSQEDIIPISYGKPGPQLLKAAQEGKTKLGGCCVQSHRFHCKHCRHDF